MTRPGRQTTVQKTQPDDEIKLPPESRLYPYCSRMKQTPVRSMLMSHGCCFDYFEKGYCRAGNDCKYSHLKPGDERTLIMDSEYGLRRKKYYRPETLTTYRPGSQDVICFTYARKGWCVHGDKCWNQHINPPIEIFQEALTSLHGLTISKTPSPVQQVDLPTPNIDSTGLGFTAQPRLPSPPAQVPAAITHQAQPWSSSTLPVNQVSETPNEHLRVAASKGNCKLFCKPDPKRTAATNWRVPSQKALPAPTTSEAAQQPVRSALNFNWRPIIDEACEYKWCNEPNTGNSTVIQGNFTPADQTFENVQNIELLIDFSEDDFDNRSYHTVQSQIPNFLH